MTVVQRTMEFAEIKGTSLRVSRVGLGTWAIGGWMWGGSDDAQSIETIRAALDHGVNLIDTAPVYGFGHSEEVVGKALAGLRGRAVIATKVGLEWKDGNVFRNASRERINSEIEDSLRRLQTDHIDIYQVHWPDPKTPVEETAEAMKALLDQGKIGAIGVSNFSVAQMERFRAVAPIHVLQPPYNLFEREIEAEILPYCLRHGIATFGYGALCRGLLVRPHEAGHGFRRPATCAATIRNSGRRALRIISPPSRGWTSWRASASASASFIWRRAGRWIRACRRRSGARAAPTQLSPIDEVSGWSLDGAAKAEIDRILKEEIPDPVGPEFMAPPARA